MSVVDLLMFLVGDVIVVVCDLTVLVRDMTVVVCNLTVVVHDVMVIMVVLPIGFHDDVLISRTEGGGAHCFSVSLVGGRLELNSGEGIDVIIVVGVELMIVMLVTVAAGGAVFDDDT